MKLLNLLMELTIYSSIIFGVTILFKWLLGDKMSPTMHLAMWSLLLIRLVMPITLESNMHFFTFPTRSTQIESYSDNLPMTAQSNLTDSLKNPGNTKQNDETSNHMRSDTSNFFNISPPVVLLAIWVTGMGCMIIVTAIGYQRLLKRTRRNAIDVPPELYALLAECQTELGIHNQITLNVQCCGKSPALLFPSTILLPVHVLQMDKDHIKMVLLHELTHYKRKDPLFTMLLLTLRIIYWFNPMIWIAESMIRDDMETACDSMVIKHLGANQKSYYAHTLTLICQRNSQAQMAWLLVVRENM